MKQKLLAVGFTVVAACFAPNWASEPGQPLDCSDWVILQPGISCSVQIPYPCADTEGQTRYGCRGPSGGSFDNAGDFYYVQGKSLGTFDCGAGVFRELIRSQVFAFRDGNDELVAYVDERCGAPGLFDAVQISNTAFDTISGRLVLAVGVRENGPGAPVNYQEGGLLVSLDGFATLFEVLHGYDPSSGKLGFAVPFMPEGFDGADWFDTYYGSLSTVGNWSMAHPLQCGYPASAPSVGDYLTVEDTLPTPLAGEGYYYVTAATYQGQTRYGRRSSGGVLTGRDPAVLPACDE